MGKLCAWIRTIRQGRSNFPANVLLLRQWLIQPPSKCVKHIFHECVWTFKCWSSLSISWTGDLVFDSCFSELIAPAPPQIILLTFLKGCTWHLLHRHITSHSTAILLLIHSWGSSHISFSPFFIFWGWCFEEWPSRRHLWGAQESNHLRLQVAFDMLFLKPTLIRLLQPLYFLGMYHSTGTEGRLCTVEVRAANVASCPWRITFHYWCGKWKIK